MERILVAGGSGLVGRRLLAALAVRGFQVTLLSRRRDPTGLPSGVGVASWSELPQAMEGVDAVVNLSGEGIAQGRWTQRRKQALLTSRVQSTTRLVEAMARVSAPPQVLVNASAIGYYGSRGSESISEQTRPGTGFLPALCQAWEAAADAALPLGPRVAKLRIGLVLAREGGALGRMAAPFRLCLGSPLGDGRQGMSWIHIDDLVAMILAALEDPRWTGAVNAVAPGPVSNADFTRALGRTLHRPLLPLPGRLTRAALRLLMGELAEELLLSGAFVEPERALGWGFGFRHPSLDEALADLLRPARPAESGGRRR